MSQLNNSQNDVQPDRIYFDITSTNTASTTTSPPVFQYQDARANPYILKPEDYWLSIIRFTMDSATLPIFVPTIQPGDKFGNTTIYSVTLEYIDPFGNIQAQQQSYVIWNPQDDSAVFPGPPFETYNGLQINQTGYYNCYSYQYFCALVYVAFTDALAGLAAQDVTIAQAVTVGLPDPSGNNIILHAPIINWDTTSNSAVLYCQEGYYDFFTGTPLLGGGHINIYMNSPLYSLYNTFPAVLQGYNQPIGKNFRFLPTNIAGINYQPIIPPDGSATWNAIVIYQEGTTTSSWTSITGIVFTSNTLPVQPNQVSTPLTYYNGQIVYAGTNANTANIITDIVSQDGIYRSNLVYNPTAEFRRITLYGNQPLYNIDVSIFYRLKSGELIPFTLQSGGTVTIKFLFEKKTKYSVK